VVGRESGRVDPGVVSRASRVDLGRVVGGHTTPLCTAYADERASYAHRGGSDRTHAAVCPAPGRRERARGDGGDGGDGVRDNTMGGRWVGRRNSPRPFRGVRKHYLGQSAAVSQRTSNLKRACPDFIQAPTVTDFAL
jgi:transposase